jgi:hypothetical protein
VRLADRSFAAIISTGIAAVLFAPGPAASPIIVDKVMPAPAWAYADRALLRADDDLVQADAAVSADSVTLALVNTNPFRERSQPTLAFPRDRAGTR